jgi:menaquinol-cytochrome c reductase iron-sulfur subunit
MREPMSDDPTDARRGFLKTATGCLGVVLGAMAAIPGLGFLASPPGSKTGSGNDEPTPVGSPDDVKPGKPARVNIYGQRRDGWLRIDRMKLGAAWLIRTPEGRVRAFSTVCPHLGCSVDWNDKTDQFVCPCHQSAFGTDGRCLFGPAPRGLDELDVVASSTEIRVRYQRFKIAVKAKEPIG